MKAPVPAELGGGGSDIVTTVLMMEALGYGCHDNRLIFSLNAQMWSLELPPVKFGTPAQQQACLPGLVSGDLIGVHAMTGCILASALGAMQRRLETCVGYARLRKQFGQAIGKFQGVDGKVADMYLRLEAARLLVYQAAWLARQGKPALAEAAAAKLFTSEAWVASSLDTIQTPVLYSISAGSRSPPSGAPPEDGLAQQYQPEYRAPARRHISRGARSTR